MRGCLFAIFAKGQGWALIRVVDNSRKPGKIPICRLDVPGLQTCLVNFFSFMWPTVLPAINIIPLAGNLSYIPGLFRGGCLLEHGNLFKEIWYTAVKLWSRAHRCMGVMPSLLHSHYLDRHATQCCVTTGCIGHWGMHGNLPSLCHVSMVFCSCELTYKHD